MGGAINFGAIAKHPLSSTKEKKICKLKFGSQILLISGDHPLFHTCTHYYMLPHLGNLRKVV